jgi:hypothetical protein
MSTLCGYEKSGVVLRKGMVFLLALVVVLVVSSVAVVMASGAGVRLRAQDDLVGRAQARQAALGVLRAVCNDLATSMVAGTMPQLVTVKPEGEVIGECTVVLLGRDPQGLRAQFGLIPEAGKISLNSLVDHDTTVPDFLKKTLRTALSSAHGMTPEITAAICDWEDSDDTVDSDGGAERTDTHYQGATIPYAPRNGRFETIDELRLVRGVTDDLFFGEDANNNGRLDPGEDANGNGKLDLGLRDLVTLETLEPGTLSTDIATDVNDISPVSTATDAKSRPELFQFLFGLNEKNRLEAVAIREQALQPQRRFSSRLHLLTCLGAELDESQMTALWPRLKGPEGRAGLVDAWSCSEQLLTSLVPAIASKIIAARPVIQPTSPAWLMNVLTPDEAIDAGMKLTVGGYQFRADILAVSRHGWARIDAMIDCSTNFPRVIHLRPTESMGWPLPWATPAMLRQADATQDFSTMLTSDRN